MDVIIISNILKAIIAVANFYMFFMFVMAVMSLLAMLGIIDIFSNSLISRVYFGLRNFINPVLSFIARFVPQVNGIDLPFLVFLIILWIVEDLAEYALNMLVSSGGMGGF